MQGKHRFIPFALSLSKGISLKIKDFDGFDKLTISPNGFELIRISQGIFFTVNPSDKNGHLLVEHLHAIWRLPEGDADFPIRWSLIKAAFSRAIPPTGMIWRGGKMKRERGISF
ncbi:MAG: hypothetical protein Q7T62_09490 [Undibacterium sp.]|nr:hypothetical protein [Undibacterium sp.]